MSTTGVPISTGFSHIVVNVSDLARSVAFYEAVTPLRCVASASAPPQPMTSLGVPQGQFAGALLRDPSAPLAPAVHLVQWQSPAFTGRTYPGFTNLGFFRICFQYNDAAASYDRAVAAGATPFTQPLFGDGKNRAGRPVFATPDPDGVVLQFICLPGLEGIYHVCCNCSDLARAEAFYGNLGLRCFMHLSTTEPEKFAFGPPGDAATLDAAVFDHPSDRPPDSSPSFSIDLVRWKIPAPAGAPYASQTNLGIVRLGLIARDLDAARAHFHALGYPVSDVEQRDFGADMGPRRALVVQNPDGAVVELFDKRM